MRTTGAILNPVFAFVDPRPLIDERIAAEIEPLVEALSQTTDRRDRRRIKREIRWRLEEIESLRSAICCW